MKIVLDARIHSDSSFKKFTVLSAIAYALKILDKDKKLVIEKAINALGEDVSIEKLRMAICKVSKKTGQKVTSKVTKNNELVIFFIE